MIDPVNFALFREITGGDPDTEKSLFDVFLSSALENITGMNTALQNNSNAEWREHAHAMKGASLSLGAEQLGNLCKEAQNGFESDNEAKSKLLVAIRSEFARVKDYLEKIYPAES